MSQWQWFSALLDTNVLVYKHSCMRDKTTGEEAAAGVFEGLQASAAGSVHSAAGSDALNVLLRAPSPLSPSVFALVQPLRAPRRSQDIVLDLMWQVQILWLKFSFFLAGQCLHLLKYRACLYFM